jgi:hypothetical protein
VGHIEEAKKDREGGLNAILTDTGFNHSVYVGVCTSPSQLIPEIWVLQQLASVFEEHRLQ